MESVARHRKSYCRTAVLVFVIGTLMIGCPGSVPFSSVYFTVESEDSVPCYLDGEHVGETTKGAPLRVETPVGQHTARVGDTGQDRVCDVTVPFISDGLKQLVEDFDNSAGYAFVYTAQNGLVTASEASGSPACVGRMYGFDDSGESLLMTWHDAGGHYETYSTVQHGLWFSDRFVHFNRDFEAVQVEVWVGKIPM